MIPQCKKCKKGKILWQNNNPNQAFEAQNIKLNSSRYDFLEFYFANTNSLRTVYTKVEKGYGGAVDAIIGEEAANYLGARKRGFKYIDDSTYFIEDAKSKYVNRNSEAEIINELLVPLKVIGY